MLYEVITAYALARALAQRPASEAEVIRQRAREATPDGPCPLLENGRCLLYAARPLICRTHGLPILIREEGQNRVDFCPLNFTGYDSLPGTALIDLERLNQVLVAVNREFVARIATTQNLPDRIPVLV